MYRSLFIGPFSYFNNQKNKPPSLFRGLDSSDAFLIGGVPTIETVLQYTGQVSTHDFVGCIRKLQVDNIDLFQVDAIRAENTGVCERTANGVCGDFCSENSVCFDDWIEARCQCNAGYSGEKCENGKSMDYIFKMA